MRVLVVDCRCVWLSFERGDTDRSALYGFIRAFVFHFWSWPLITTATIVKETLISWSSYRRFVMKYWYTVLSCTHRPTSMLKRTYVTTLKSAMLSIINAGLFAAVDLLDLPCQRTGEGFLCSDDEIGHDWSLDFACYRPNSSVQKTTI